MPPVQFKLIPPEAPLTGTERAELADGLARSLGD